ncbi:MAG: hypothetical protein ACM3KH_00175 [Thiobacillus sp.]
MRPNIYLDIDGVLLANEKFLAQGAEEFIEYVVSRYPTFWLTTHCMDNNPTLAVNNVGKLCKPKTLEFLKQIKPTAWKTAKTEAIDFSHPFLWFDDDLYDDEREELLRRDALSSWIEVDLNKYPDQLKTFFSHHLE